MHFEEGHIYHIYNRGNNRQLIFFNNENYRYFLHKVKFEILPLIDILAYCLMPNHFHFLVQVKELEIRSEIRQTTSHLAKALEIRQTTSRKANAQGSGQTNVRKANYHPLVRKIANLLSSYTRAVNIQQNRTGSLFQKKTKAKSLTEEERYNAIKRNHNTQHNYVFNCFHYIHQNPWKARLVKKPEDWEFSSFHDYTGQINETLCNKQLAYEIINFDQENFYEQSYIILQEKDIEGIW